MPDPNGTHGLDGVEFQLWREQLHTALDEAMSSLPEADRDTLRRRFYLGQTLAEAAQETGTSPEDIRKHEASGLRALRHPRLSRSLRAFIEENTPYYLHVGASRFNTTHTSAVEEIVMRREKLQGTVTG